MTAQPDLATASLPAAASPHGSPKPGGGENPLPAIGTVWRTTDRRWKTRRYTVLQHLEPRRLPSGRVLEQEILCLRSDTKGRRDVHKKLRAFDPFSGHLLPVVHPAGDDDIRELTDAE